MNQLFESPAEDITRLILVRHGRTKKNFESRIGAREDSPLDELGKEQARRVAKRLEEFPISKIFSSPIQRTKETAEAIAGNLALDIEFCDDLIEYNFGVIGGMTMAGIQQKFPSVYNDLQEWIYQSPAENNRRKVVPEAETFEHLEQRVLAFTDFITANYLGQTVVAVTHLAIIKVFMATLFGRTVFKPMNFIADNTSVTVIDFLRKRPILMNFNDTRHLDQNLRYGKITPL
jgi:broad specificity phosphatase PhoE